MLNFNNTTSQEVDIALFEGVLRAARDLLVFVGTVELTLVDREAIRSLNKKYAQNDYATDVLSWAHTEANNNFEHELLGESYICLEIAAEQALTKQHSLDYELQYLFAHGLLHILGYDHQDEQTTKEMDQLTERIVELAQSIDTDSQMAI